MTIDFGVARAIDAQTFGEPGERTFRLRVVGADEQTASLWLEKQQLQAFDLAFRQMLAQTGYQEEPSPLAVTDFPEAPQHDFRVGRIALGFDPSDRSVVLHAFAIDNEDQNDPTLSVRLTQEQCAALVPMLREIIAGGRPVCALCGASIDTSGHVCIRANGHSRQQIPEERSGEEES